MKLLLKIIYIGAFAPILMGSLTFFYWYYERFWFAKDVSIEILALLSIYLFVILGFIALIFSVGFAVSGSNYRKKIIIPVLVIFLTIPVIDLYSRAYSALSEKAFVRVINDTEGLRIEKIRSANFEIFYFDEKDFIISYYPVYIYDWTSQISGRWYNYEISNVTIDIVNNDTTITYDFPNLSKGECVTIKLSEIIN